jgi:prepilin-type N-terminal cleavage/methylation domain-containing protein
MVRAFSLVEAMVVVAIISVLAAMAAPSLIDVVWAQRLEGAAEVTAAAIAAARMEAMTTKRCARVVIEPGALHIERLNVFDCDAPTADPQPARLDGNQPLWVRLSTVTLDDPVTLSSGAPWTDALPGGGGALELRFRPSGRLFSQDENDALQSHGAVLIARHPKLPAERGKKQIGVQPNGLECVMPRGSIVPMSVEGNVVCP